ncbi:MAG TPA: PP2C family protein-serine/threonine phosphatase [Acidobacteriaceae bacterium]
MLWFQVQVLVGPPHSILASNPSPRRPSYFYSPIGTGADTLVRRISRVVLRLPNPAESPTCEASPAHFAASASSFSHSSLCCNFRRSGSPLSQHSRFLVAPLIWTRTVCPWPRSMVRGASISAMTPPALTPLSKTRHGNSCPPIRARPKSQSPAEILSAMNQRMIGRSSGGFTTCLVLRVAPDGTLTGANAGHISPYVNSGELQLENGLPLGLSADASYAESTFHLAMNDRPTLLTDGVIEARNKTGELFRFDRAQSSAANPLSP